MQKDRLKTLESFFEELARLGWQGFDVAYTSQPRGLTVAHFPYASALDGVIDALSYAREILSHTTVSIDFEHDRKDQLFDQLMVLFDTFAPMRPGIQIVYEKLCKNPCLLRALHQDVFDVLSLILQKSAISIPPLFGSIKVWVFGVSVLCMLKTWIEDASLDLSKTMVVVDENLSNLKSIVEFFPWINQI